MQKELLPKPVLKRTRPTTKPKEKNEAPPIGGYKVENVVLLNSIFQRETNIDFKVGAVSHEINISSEAHESTPEGQFGVTLQLEFKGKQMTHIVCTATIKMIGIFEKNGEPPLPEDIFKKINAPAIIYPFIREHLHNICLKAGISNIFLPTVNFKI